MRLCILVSGLLRNFSKTLFPYLCQLGKLHELDIYISTGKETTDSKYFNSETQKLSDILSHPSVKLFLLEDITLEGIEGLTQREKNTLFQWYRLEKLVSLLPSKPYDWYIRIRPDIDIQVTTETFSKVLASLSTNSLHIPIGNDIFDSSFLTESPLKPFNDQLAFIPHCYLRIYCSVYSSILIHQRPLISEYSLASHLANHSIQPQRFYLPYTLCLSSCKVLAIAGDSGSGKSTIINAIEQIFPFDSSVTLETDRYHKWERSHSNWSSITHLHPDANNLEKLLDDTYCLKLGKDIFSVDYDHSSGKFTEPQHIQSKDIVLLCGLHTLYQHTLRDHIDIKIYVDTQEELKTFWKLQRDVCQRNYSEEQVLEKIKKRQQDFRSFILPQKDHANVILSYSTQKEHLKDIHSILTEKELDFEIQVKSELLSYCFTFLNSFSRSFSKFPNDTISFQIKKDIDKQGIVDALQNERITFTSEKVVPGYLGVIQALTLRLLFHT
jgi:uridine kinase